MKSAQRITKHAVEAADEVHDEIEAIKTSFKELRGDVVDLISHAFGVGRGGAHAAQGTASEAVDQLKKKLVELKGLGDRFSGMYYVASCVHSLGPGGYYTFFNVRRSAS